MYNWNAPHVKNADDKNTQPTKEDCGNLVKGIHNRNCDAEDLEAKFCFARLCCKISSEFKSEQKALPTGCISSEMNGQKGKG